MILYCAHVQDVAQEMKQQPGWARTCNKFSCCLISTNFLCEILNTSTVFAELLVTTLSFWCHHRHWPLGLADKGKSPPPSAAVEEKPFPKYSAQFAAFIGPLIAIEKGGEREREESAHRHKSSWSERGESKAESAWDHLFMQLYQVRHLNAPHYLSV